VCHRRAAFIDRGSNPAQIAIEQIDRLALDSQAGAAVDPWPQAPMGVTMNDCHPSDRSGWSFRPCGPGQFLTRRGRDALGRDISPRGPSVFSHRPASSALPVTHSAFVIRNDAGHVKRARFTTNQALRALLGALRAIWVDDLHNSQTKWSGVFSSAEMPR